MMMIRIIVNGSMYGKSLWPVVCLLASLLISPEIKMPCAEHVILRRKIRIQGEKSE